MKNHLLLPLLAAILILSFGCKKEKLETTVLHLEKSSFPTIKNLTNDEFTKLTELLKKSDGNYKKATEYINLISQKRLVENKSLADSRRSSILTISNNSSLEMTTETFGENNSVNLLQGDFQGLLPDYELYDPSDGPVIFPNYYGEVEYSGYFAGRMIQMTVIVPYAYALKFYTFDGSTPFWVLKTRDGAFPRMDLTGALGELTVLERDFTVNPAQSFGFAEASARITMRERRTRIVDEMGNNEIVMGVKADGMAIGGNSSYGYKVTEKYDIISTFNYTGSYLFFGQNTGYSKTRAEYVKDLENYSFTPFGLLQPVMGCEERGIYSGYIN